MYFEQHENSISVIESYQHKVALLIPIVIIVGQYSHLGLLMYI